MAGQRQHDYHILPARPRRGQLSNQPFEPSPAQPLLRHKQRRTYLDHETRTGGLAGEV